MRKRVKITILLVVILTFIIFLVAAFAQKGVIDIVLAEPENIQSCKTVEHTTKELDLKNNNPIQVQVQDLSWIEGGCNSTCEKWIKVGNATCEKGESFKEADREPSNKEL